MYTSSFLFFSAIFVSELSWTRAATTFVATKNTNLSPIPVKDLTVNNISSAVASTQLYGSFYKPAPFDDTSVTGTTDTVPSIELIRGSDVEADKTIRASPFGLVGTVSAAYAGHHNVAIRPDDIWVTIQAQFSAYVNSRAEELRDFFVNFEGKEALEIRIAGRNIYNLDWSFIPPRFLDLIAERIKDPSLREWFLPGFTTTTPNDEVAAAAAAMCTLQEYFRYTVNFGCGIPQATLEGTVEDWELLRAKIERLTDFDDGTGILTDEWVPMLRGVLDNFVESAKNGSDNNLDWWDQIAHSIASGYGGSTLSGWINTFTFFDQKGDRALYPASKISGPWGTIDADDVNPNIISCPIEITGDYDLNSTLFVGQMTYEQVDDGSTMIGHPAVNPTNVGGITLIKPRNDWALVIEDGQFLELQRPRTGDVPQAKLPQCVEPRLNTALLVFNSEAPTPTPNGVGSGVGCFSGQSIVEVLGKGCATVASLEIGDLVKSDGNFYSRIYSFGHREPAAQAEFLQIHAIGLSKPLEISRDHLLMSNDVMVPASSVRVGDRLTAVTGRKTTIETAVVKKITKVRRQGVFAPFTEAGTIVVNGVVSSNYVTLQNDSRFLVVAGIETPFTMHWLAHSFQAVHRSACKINWSWCEKETYSDRGVSMWVDRPNTFFTWALHHQFTLLVVFLATLSLLCRPQGKQILV
jgi:hypothetical protein